MKRYRFVFWAENRKWEKEFDSVNNGNKYALEYEKENGMEIDWDYDDCEYVLEDVKKLEKFVEMYGAENILRLINGEELSAGELHDIAFAGWCDGKWKI